MQQVAAVLANPAGTPRVSVEAAVRSVLTEVLTYQDDPTLAPWATHMYRVTRSYWAGLFPCYEDATIPRTNNDLEQYFGAAPP